MNKIHVLIHNVIVKEAIEDYKEEMFDYLVEKAVCWLDARLSRNNIAETHLLKNAESKFGSIYACDLTTSITSPRTCKELFKDFISAYGNNICNEAIRRWIIKFGGVIND